MRILVIGGTKFLGPAVVHAATARGHTVTLFNRGRTNPGLFPDLETVVGDRNEELEPLKGREFDAVIDTCGYYPSQVERSAGFLAERVHQYVFVSTLSVFVANNVVGLTEQNAVGRLDATTEARLGALTMRDVSGDTYGPLKARCERAAEDAMPGRTTIVRPGLIVGPLDPSNRFRYWPWRAHRAGTILAPGPEHARQQFIDVRDLAEFIVKTIDDGHAGTFNVVGPAGPMTMEEMLYGCLSVTNRRGTLAWVDQEFLLKNSLETWSIPCWVPDQPDWAGFNAYDCTKAIAHGLAFRPLADTCLAVVEELARLGRLDHWEFGEALLEQEADLLARWRAERRP